MMKYKVCRLYGLAHLFYNIRLMDSFCNGKGYNK
jgi:hypothetical protein